MKILSPAFAGNHEIPIEYTCDGDNINPPLVTEDVPREAKSLVLIVDDPDVAEGVFTHWVVWNINSKIEEIGEGEVPEGGVEGINNAGERGYMGPCPPYGTHHYIFHLYALDSLLSLPGSTGRDEVEDQMSGHVIAEAQLTGLYSHKEGQEEHLREMGEELEE